MMVGRARKSIVRWVNGLLGIKGIEEPKGLLSGVFCLLIYSTCLAVFS